MRTIHSTLTLKILNFFTNSQGSYRWTKFNVLADGRRKAVLPVSKCQCLLGSISQMLVCAVCNFDWRFDWKSIHRCLRNSQFTDVQLFCHKFVQKSKPNWENDNFEVTRNRPLVAGKKCQPSGRILINWELSAFQLAQLFCSILW